MPIRWEEEAPRLARLASLHLEPDEEAALARACEAITRDFGDLAAYATTLPEAGTTPAGALREDEVHPAPIEEVAAILHAAGKVDATRRIVVPRGLP